MLNIFYTLHYIIYYYLFLQCKWNLSVLSGGQTSEDTVPNLLLLTSIGQHIHWYQYTVPVISCEWPGCMSLALVWLSIVMWWWMNAKLIDLMLYDDVTASVHVIYFKYSYASGTLLYHWHVIDGTYENLYYHSLAFLTNVSISRKWKQSKNSQGFKTVEHFKEKRKKTQFKAHADFHQHSSSHTKKRWKLG